MSFPHDFLTEIARTKKLSDPEIAVFLLLFGQDKNKVQIANELETTESAVRNRLTRVYKKFGINDPGPVKERELRRYLEERQKRKPPSSLSNLPAESVKDPVDALVQQERSPLHDDIYPLYENLQVEGLKVEEIKSYLSQVKSLSLYTYPDAEDDWEILVAHYGGNLKAIEIVAKRIHERYNDDISNYVCRELKQGSNSVLEEIEQLLDRQFDELNNREQQIMYLLAIANDPMKIEEIEFVLLCQVNTNKLEHLSLIKKSNSGSYSQIPMVVDYVTKKLINEIVIEICVRSPRLLNEYPLLQAQSKDYIKDLQKCRILKPIVDRLLKPEKLGGQKPIEDSLKFMLDNWRIQKPKYGYLGGNIINIFLFGLIETDLRGYDLSEIPVWNAELKDAYLPEVNLSNSDLYSSNFAEDLSGVRSICFSRDGNYFVTGEANGNVRLWETRNSKQIKIFSNQENHSNQVWAVAFSPDGKIIAIGGENKIVQLWNVESGEKRKDIQVEQCVYSVAFSFDGNILAIAGDDGIALWDTSTIRRISFISKVKQVYSVAFSNCNTLVSGSQDRTVRLWDISNIDRPQPLREWREHQAAVRCVAFSPDDITIASGSEDGSIRLWNVDSDRSFKTLKHDDVKQVWTVAFSPDAKILASGSCDNSPAGIDEHHNISLWSIDDGKRLKILGTSKDGHKNQLRSVAFFPNSQNQESNLLISGGDDCAIKIWDVNNRKCQKTIQGYTNRIWSAAFSQNGQILVTGSEDNKIRLWDIQNGKCVRSSLKTLSGHTDWVWSVVFSPDGNMLASASEDNTIKLWRLKNGKWQEEYTLKQHTDRVRIVAFSQDGKKLASGGNDYKVILWDVSTHKVIKALEQNSGGHNRRILSLAFSPNDDLIASSSLDKTIRLWNYKTNRIDILGEHDNQVHSITFSPDGNYL
jgi:WD40 repeat protein